MTEEILNRYRQQCARARTYRRLLATLSKRTEEDADAQELQHLIRSTWLAPVQQELSDLYPQVSDFLKDIRGTYERRAMRFYLAGLSADQAAAMAVKDGNEIETEIVQQNITSILLAVRHRSPDYFQ